MNFFSWMILGDQYPKLNMYWDIFPHHKIIRIFFTSNLFYWIWVTRLDCQITQLLSSLNSHHPAAACWIWIYLIILIYRNVIWKKFIWEMLWWGTNFNSIHDHLGWLTKFWKQEEKTDLCNFFLVPCLYEGYKLIHPQIRT